jgi:site-specific recombinase XerC
MKRSETLSRREARRPELASFLSYLANERNDSPHTVKNYAR